MYCSYCGSNAHTKALCPSTYSGSARRANLRCTYCGAKDHSIKACPKTYSGNAARAWHPESVKDHFYGD